MDAHNLQPIKFDSVADLYDSFVNADFDIPFWTEEAAHSGGSVLELACGTGRVSLPLLTAGVRLTCVDYAPGMLVQLNHKLIKRRLACPIFCQDIAALALPELFDLIIYPFHSFSEILDPERQREALRRIRAHLTAEGRFICTLHNPAVRIASLDGVSRRIGERQLDNGDTLIVTAAISDDSAAHAASGEQIYERLSPELCVMDRRTLAINFYVFDRSEFEALIGDAGFEVEEFYGGYDRHAFESATSPFMIWKLRSR